MDLLAGTAIAWSILAAVAVMEARDWRSRKNDEGRGAHPGRSPQTTDGVSTVGAPSGLSARNRTRLP